MSVKILGGKARGFPLATPKSETTRPTSVMIKRKLFDWRQNLEGEIFIDLFSGSGAMGLEALSRGAEKVFLNDSSRAAFLTLKQNSERMSQSFDFSTDSISVTNLDALKWVEKEMGYQLVETENAILYLDPPYKDHEAYFKVIKSLGELKFAGEIWLEAEKNDGPKQEKLLSSFQTVIKSLEQGDRFVIIGKVN